MPRYCNIEHIYIYIRKNDVKKNYRLNVSDNMHLFYFFLGLCSSDGAWSSLGTEWHCVKILHTMPNKRIFHWHLTYAFMKRQKLIQRCSEFQSPNHPKNSRMKLFPHLVVEIIYITSQASQGIASFGMNLNGIVYDEMHIFRFVIRVFGCCLYLFVVVFFPRLEYHLEYS